MLRLIVSHPNAVLPWEQLCPPVSLNGPRGQVAQTGGRCVLCRVCVCFSALSGGALNKVELHDLLILEQSGYKTFLKSWRGC